MIGKLCIVTFDVQMDLFGIWAVVLTFKEVSWWVIFSPIYIKFWLGFVSPEIVPDACKNPKNLVPVPKERRPNGTRYQAEVPHWPADTKVHSCANKEDQLLYRHVLWRFTLQIPQIGRCCPITKFYFILALSTAVVKGLLSMNTKQNKMRKTTFNKKCYENIRQIKKKKKMLGMETKVGQHYKLSSKIIYMNNNC